MNLKKKLNNKIFKIVSQAADELGYETYVIGGFVRDLLLNSIQPKDIDFVCVGSGIELAQKVKSILDGANLGILVNNAGIAQLGPVEHISSQEFDLHLKTMVVGTFNCVQIFLPLLGTKNRFSPGKVINISSGGGSIGQPFMASYCSSKHALEGFSESLRRELLIYGIKVIIIAPRAFKTAIWDKSNVDDRAAEFNKTEYRRAFEKFTNFIKDSSKKGQDVKVLAQKIYKISLMRKPKVKYSMGPSGLEFYLIRTLPKRFIDKILGKYFLLIK